jgi:hypothetical protein
MFINMFELYSIEVGCWDGGYVALHLFCTHFAVTWRGKNQSLNLLQSTCAPAYKLLALYLYCRVKAGAVKGGLDGLCCGG